MTKEDQPAFSQLLLQIDLVCRQIGTKKEIISNETIGFYFEILKDVPFEIIKKNAVRHFQSNNGFFPSPAALREDGNEKELQAQLAWSRINWYLDRFYSPDFGRCSMQIIERKMKESKEEHLLPLLNQWGPEIISGGAIAATRKHFLDSYKAELIINDRKQLEVNNKPLVALAEEVSKKLTVGEDHE